MEVDQSITRFVYEWFDDLSAHEPVDRMLPRLRDDGLEMVFPERTLRGYDDFLDWYEGVGKAFADQTHTVEEVRCEQRGDLIELAITVVWTATDTADRTRSSFRAHQTWRLRRDDDGGLRIVTYRVDDLSPLSTTGAEDARGRR
ncbi:nuclear transport factor 2 family protein [Streptomyces sp. 8L]|uniref:nuclear transport factor 2 family protein n=1 Tax=unclassified Streptomyces TaxID=2593676 RepID=UPI001CD3A31E|nr:nuclear transport factor 2 family protein [Streptomyces sp. 8L]MCA1216889.1 nuclear transport factor 2 family protein [Streptomyces sp. 8L]